MFLYNTLAQNVNDNIFVMAQSGSKVHRLFISKCRQRHGGNDEDTNNSNKKSAKLEKKIHWSMKHSKAIKMAAAAGTGATEVAIDWLLCRGAQVFLMRNLPQAGGPTHSHLPLPVFVGKMRK